MPKDRIEFAQFDDPTERAITPQGMAAEPDIRREIFLQHLTEFYIPTYIPKFPRYMQFFKKSNS
jgi:hypothetical protein